MGRLGRIWLILFLVPAGCSILAGRPKGLKEPSSNLPLVERKSLQPDPKQLPGLEALRPVIFEGRYRAIDETECACRAAQASGTANLLDKEAHMLSPILAHGPERLWPATLRYTALEARNKDAGTAMELYYRLAELEAKHDILADSLRDVELVLAEKEKLKKQGVRVPPEFEGFPKQRLDLLADRVRLQAGIEKLNRQLARMLDIPGVPEQEHFWPALEASINVAPRDRDAEVAKGLSSRPQLQLLRQAQSSGLLSMSAMRKLLAASSGLLGADQGKASQVRAILCAHEGAVRKEQIDELADQRRREVADEIRQAISDLEAQTQLMVIARENVLRLRADYDKARDQRARGTASLIDETAAHLAWLKANAELVQEVMAWRLAGARLKQAQGLLARECSAPQFPADDEVPVLPEILISR
jgi:hypothetical protein